MTAKLPHWIEASGFGLAAVAGAVNAIGVLSLQQQPVSHVTGTTTALSLSLVHQNSSLLTHSLMVLLAFTLGAIVSGAIIENAVLKLGRRYSMAFLLESALLATAMLLLGQSSVTGHYFAAAACGLQNGMVSTYSGAIVRTTHMTGLFTDLGTMLGLRLRGHAIDIRRAQIYLLLISGFLVGGIIGGAGFERWNHLALLIPIVVTALLGLWCWFHRRNGKEPSPVDGAPTGAAM
ncbi:MAG: YoaK family protein [Planctomycetaceae bacterium]